MAVTQSEIARALGVSHVTVSKVLHRANGQRISPELQDRIWQKARELGYTPRTLTTHTIGYVLPVEKLVLEAEVESLMHLQRALAMRGYRLTMAELDPRDPQALRGVLNPKTVDGVIFSRWYGGAIRQALVPQIPWLLTSDEDGVPCDVDLVSVDMEGTLRNVIRYLLERGHERFCLIVGGSDTKFHRLIKHGARWALADSGHRHLKLTPVEVMNNRQIAAPLLEALRASEPVTAVIAANPGMAVPALYTARTAGFRVPEDVSFVTLFDVPGVQVLDPQMTATTAGGHELAERTVARMLERIQNPQAPAEQLRLPGDILERETVAAPG